MRVRYSTKHTISISIAFLLLCSLAPFKEAYASTEAKETVPSIVAPLHVNWGVFWQKVNQHALWDLECDSGAGWISIKSDLTVIRSYPQNNTCKVTLVFKASKTGDYRITFAFDVKVKKYVAKLDKYQYELNYDDYSLIFDWSDIVNIANIQISHGIKNVDGQNFFWFRMQRDNILKGAYVGIDPSIISTSGDVNMEQPQRKTFIDNQTRFWCYYANTSGIYAEWSSDGSVWDNTVITVKTQTLVDSRDFSIRYYFYDSHAYVYLAWINGSKSAYASVYFRRDEINGTDLIIGTQYTVLTGSYNIVGFPDVEVGTDGRVFVCFYRVQTVGLKAYDHFIYSNPNNSGSGSWIGKSYWWLNFSASRNYEYSGLTRLTNGRVYTVWNGVYNGYNMRGAMWNGSVWNSTYETVYASAVFDEEFGLASYGDRVYISLGLLDAFTYNKLVWRNETDGAWSSKEDFTTVHSWNGDSHITVNSTNGDLWVFWKSNNVTMYGDVVYHHRYYNGTWDVSTTSWFNDGTELLESTISPFWIVTNNVIGLLYALDYPYLYIKYAVLSLAVSKVWYDVSAWTVSLVARTWSSGTSWSLNLSARQWIQTEILTFTLTGKTFLDVAIWDFTFRSRDWTDGDTWFFSLRSPGWMLVALWNLQLGPGAIAFLFIAILLLIVIVAGIIAVAYRRPKR